jgi:hypothetical protein
MSTVAKIINKILARQIQQNIKKLTRHQWLTPVNLATQEAEIKRIVV